VLQGSRPIWQFIPHIEPRRRLPRREVTLDHCVRSLDRSLARSLATGRGTPVGRRAQKCRVAVVIKEASRSEALFDKETVGRSLSEPSGFQVEIIGVLGTPKGTNYSGRGESTMTLRSTITTTNQTGLPHARAICATSRATRVRAGERTELDTNSYSRSYFGAIGHPCRSQSSAIQVPRVACRRDHPGAADLSSVRKTQKLDPPGHRRYRTPAPRSSAS